MSLGKTIKLLRIGAGLKQKELAQELGVTANYLSLIETNKREPSITLVKDLASVLNVPVSVIFFDIEEEYDNLTPEQRLIFLEIKDLILKITRYDAHT